MRKLAILTLALFLCVGTVFAAASKNTGKSNSSSSSSGSFGIGYSKANFNQAVSGVNDAPDLSFDEIAGRYWFDDKFAIDVQLGFGSGDATSRFLIGGKVVGNVLTINNLNIYFFGGLAFGSFTLKGNGRDQDASVFSINGGVGAEYYVLPCLSVLTEMGIRYISLKPDGGNSFDDFGVYADWLPQAGVRFYF